MSGMADKYHKLQQLEGQIDKAFLQGAGIDRDRSERFLKKLTALLGHLNSSNQEYAGHAMELKFIEGPLKGGIIMLDGKRPFLFGQDFENPTRLRELIEEATKQAKSHVYLDNMTKIPSLEDYEQVELL